MNSTRRLTLSAIVAVGVLSACSLGNQRTPVATETVPSTPAQSAAPSPVRYHRFYCRDEQSVFSSGITKAPQMDEVSIAATRGDAARIKALIDNGTDVKKSDSTCSFAPGGFICRPPPLTLAVRSGNIAAVRLLLNAGVDVNAGISDAQQKLASNALGQLCIQRIGTPLSSATGDYVVYAGPRYLMGEGLLWPLPRRMARQTKLVDILLKAGADPNVRKGLMEPISDVARLGNVDAVRLLLDYGSEVNPRSASMTPLRWAIHWSRVDIIDELLNRGANLNAKDSYGVTDLQYAIDESDSKVVETISAFCQRTKKC